MIRRFFSRYLDRFQRRWGYDVGYLREILAADPMALIAFNLAAGLGRYRKGVPVEVHGAVQLVSVMVEDCGPCAQLGIDMALASGMAPEVLRAIVQRDFAAMPAEIALGVRFADASLAHAPEALEMRDDIVRLWGERGLISLAFALTAGRVYPTVKYAMGHGRACARLKIAGETQVVRPMLHAA